MFGSYIVMIETLGLFLRDENDFLRIFGKSFCHLTNTPLQRLLPLYKNNTAARSGFDNLSDRAFFATVNQTRH